MRMRLVSFTAAMVLAASGAIAAEPPLSGTVSVEATAVEPGLKAAVAIYADAVGRALAAKEFTLLADPGHSRYVVDLKLSYADAGTTTGKVPVKGASAEPGGSARSVGGSLNIALPTGKTKTMALRETRLEISIRKRGEPALLWHGTAMTVRGADAPQGQDAAVAAALSEALFKAYPAQSETVISVP